MITLLVWYKASTNARPCVASPHRRPFPSLRTVSCPDSPCARGAVVYQRECRLLARMGKGAADEAGARVNQRQKRRDGLRGKVKGQR